LWIGILGLKEPWALRRNPVGIQTPANCEFQTHVVANPTTPQLGLLNNSISIRRLIPQHPSSPPGRVLTSCPNGASSYSPRVASTLGTPTQRAIQRRRCCVPAMVDIEPRAQSATPRQVRNRTRKNSSKSLFPIPARPRCTPSIRRRASATTSNAASTEISPAFASRNNPHSKVRQHSGRCA
jgi:hypothetical protein